MGHRARAIGRRDERGDRFRRVEGQAQDGQ
jgi:hypothetical protein